MSCDDKWLKAESDRLLEILSEPDPVEGLFLFAFRQLEQRNAEWAAARAAGAARVDKDGNLKPHIVAEMEVVKVIAALVREVDSWDEMELELPLELHDRNVRVSRNTLKRILERWKPLLSPSIGGP